MFTTEFESARYLPADALKSWLEGKRKRVRFYTDFVTFRFSGREQPIESQRTKNRTLCVTPTSARSGYVIGHIPTGKQFSTWVFPSADTVKGIVAALEDCGVVLTEPGALPRPLVQDLHQFIHRVFMELHRF